MRVLLHPLPDLLPPQALKVAGALCGHRAAALQPLPSRVFLFAAGQLVNNSRELSGGHVDRRGTFSPSSTVLFLTSSLLCVRLRNSCPIYASSEPAPIIVCLHAAARGICDFCCPSDSCSRASFCTFSLLLDALFPAAFRCHLHHTGEHSADGFYPVCSCHKGSTPHLTSVM